ncbi:DMT family transporter [Caldalkalibacillus mannanilyticus]|uniref:DMT family transporter n=1 Tax=Caldalkalibacillus mannanilyticus TaxID=1418 RepID=UPI000684D14C|nr:DMT family transporter [Caldalkalibacillus mannanilyticus]
MNDQSKIVVNPLGKEPTGTEISLHSRLNKGMIPLLFILMWSSGAIFVKMGLLYADPLIFLFFRFLFSSFIFWGVWLVWKSALPTSFKEWMYIIITGLCMQAGYQIFYFFALDYHVSPGLLAIILGAQPIITTFIFKKESGYLQWIGLIMGILGLALVVIDSVSLGNISTLGIISSLLSLCCITGGTILQKSIKVNQLSNMAIQCTAGTFFLSFFVYYLEQNINWSPLFALSLSWMVLVITVGATLLLYHLIRKGNLTNVTSLFYGVPP